MQKERQVRKLICAYYKENQNKIITQEDIHVQQLFSLANDVYRIELNQAQPLLIKIYQPSLQEFTDNHLQTEVVSQLALKDLYPKILYTSEAYRIQKFITTLPVSNDTVNHELILSVVQQLASYSCDFKQYVLNYNITNKKESIFSIETLHNIFWNIYDVKKQECPDLLQQCQESIDVIWKNNTIITKLKDILKSTERVLSHNDSHLGNILLTEKNIYLLDFQFSQFNYIGFDLGNFFNQWTTDYGEVFDIKKEKQIDETIKKKMMHIYYNKLSQKYNVSKNQQYWIWYTQLGRVLSHLFWMIIGLKQINDPRISFSMVGYIKKREEQLQKHMNILMQLPSPDKY